MHVPPFRHGFSEQGVWEKKEEEERLYSGLFGDTSVYYLKTQWRGRIQFAVLVTTSTELSKYLNTRSTGF